MKIRLNELPEEGESFHFGQKDEPIKDSTFNQSYGNTPYKVDFTIQPMDQVFSVNGRIQTEIDEVCSKCGDGFKLKLDFPINELLCLEGEEPRNSSYAKVNNFSEMANLSQSVTELPRPVLDPGTFIYELIAVSTPERPYCGHSGNGNFDKCAKFGDQPNDYDEDIGELSTHRPFTALKDVLKKN